MYRKLKTYINEIFFVKDRLDKKEFRVDYCPTGNMIADIFTKPLQGALFNKFRAVIMGWEHIDTLSSPRNKERVENKVFPAEDMNATITFKKSYADAVKNDHSNLQACQQQQTTAVAEQQKNDKTTE